MSPGDIYAKTDAGLREIKERKLNLSVALRSILIMIDGRHTVADLISRAKVLRVDESVFASLEKSGLIELRAGSARAADAPPAPVSKDAVERYLTAQKLMSQAINTHLGFRGYTLMMRLQRTSTLADLRQLLPDLARAIVKRIGMDAATPVVVEIEQLLA